MRAARNSAGELYKYPRGSSYQLEQAVVDARNGRVPNANFAEYAVPVHADAPRVMDVTFVEEDDPHVNPLGVKGIAELATTPPASGYESCPSHPGSCCENSSVMREGIADGDMDT